MAVSTAVPREQLQSAFWTPIRDDGWGALQEDGGSVGCEAACLLQCGSEGVGGWACCWRFAGCIVVLCC